MNIIKKIFLLLIFLLVSSNCIYASEEAFIMSSQLGIVESVRYEDVEINNENQIKQVADIKLLSKDFKNKVISLDNMLTGNPYYDIKLTKGMKVILHAEVQDGIPAFAIEDIYRSPVLGLLCLLFFGLLIYVGRKKGVYSLISIILSCGFIFYILSPMVLFGISPILTTLFVSLLATTVTMYLVGGLNKKSSSAVIGCFLSLLTSSILSIIVIKLSHLNGFCGENTLFLYSAHPELNFLEILVSTMILATLGAVMDVAMSIASTINEIYTIDSSKTVKELFLSGMNVGRDIIGTMANTLILVYLGASLPLLLLSSNIDLQKFINLNQVFTEISSALIGSCGIVICVPLTAFVASYLIKTNKEKIDFSILEE